jgi:hypothetical protein
VTEAELVAYLADLMAAGQITEAEAAALLARFETGTAPELADRPPDPEPDRADWTAALLFVLLLLGANADRTLTAVQRRQARDVLRARFGADVTRLAGQVTAGTLGAGQWERNMQSVIMAYTLRMAVTGAGTLPQAATRQRVAGRLPEQRVFLDRFTVQLAARQPGARPMSTASIAARAELYGGVAWGAFFIGQADRLDQGWVERWVARDDGNTCGPCSAVNGELFLPGEGPMPGAICLGRGRCRCERRPEFNPEAAARLRGTA